MRDDLFTFQLTQEELLTTQAALAFYLFAIMSAEQPELERWRMVEAAYTNLQADHSLRFKLSPVRELMIPAQDRPFAEYTCKLSRCCNERMWRRRTDPSWKCLRCSTIHVDQIESAAQ